MKTWHRRQLQSLLLISSSVVLLMVPVSAQVPQLLAYHGRLTQTNGVSLTGEHTVVFRIYDAENGGLEMWKEPHQVLLTVDDNGLFSAMLGGSKPLDTLDFNRPLWLSLEIDSQGEMTPRQRLAAVGYAINADTLDGLDSTQFVRLDSASTITKQLTLTNASVALLIKPAAAPPANTKLLDIQTFGGDSRFSVDAEGDVAVAGNLAVSGSISGASVASGTVTSVDSGAGLTGGPVTSTGTLAVGAGDGIAVSADAVSVNIAGGGGLAASGSGLSLLRTCSDGQMLKWTAATDMWACAEDLNTPDTNSGGDITGVTAGTGLTGGGASGDVTLNIGSGPGMIVNADSIAVDVGTGASQVVQLDASAKLPAVDASALTNVNASALATGTVPDARLSSSVSLLGSSIESSEITDGTIVSGDTADTFLTAGSGVTLSKGASSWTISATGTGGDITGVTAGTGLTGGGASGDVTLSLSAPVTIADGGTNATSASAARSNLGAAASGANGDITSLSGLTTPVSVGQGGTGAASLTAGGVLLGQGTSAVTTTGVLAKGSLLVGDGATDPTVLSVGGDRTMLLADSTTTSGVRWAVGCMPVGGSDDSSRSGTFEMGAFGAGSTTNRFDRLWPVPTSGTVSGLQAYVNTSPGSGKSWTVTIRQNGADTSLTCVISGANKTCTASGTVTYAAGDRLGIQFVEGGAAAGTQGAGWSTCFIPD